MLEAAMEKAVTLGLTSLSIWHTGHHWCASTQWNHETCNVTHGKDDPAALLLSVMTPPVRRKVVLEKAVPKVVPKKEPVPEIEEDLWGGLV